MSHRKTKRQPDFSEYEAVLHKIGSFSKKVSSQYAEELNCKKGCSQCCVAGLEVLPVEAAYIQQGLAAQGPSDSLSLRGSYCDFLDVSGACQIYAFRPLVCRTHGLPLKMESLEPVSKSLSLRVLNDDVVTCHLNFLTDREPAPADVLSEIQIQALLHVVNVRFCQTHQIQDPLRRTPLTHAALGKDS